MCLYLTVRSRDEYLNNDVSFCFYHRLLLQERANFFVKGNDVSMFFAFHKYAGSFISQSAAAFVFQIITFMAYSVY